MQVFNLGNAEEVKKGRIWWQGLEMQWKFAFNQAIFGKGPSMEPPKDEELVMLLLRADSLRFAGPGATAPNIGSALTNLSGVAALTHLTYLSFTHSSVTSLQEIRHHTNMRNLFVYNNQLTSLKGIEFMTNLEELFCMQNQITTLGPLKHLIKLKTVYVNDNKLINLDGITEDHGHHLRHFYVEPNDDLPNKEIIRVQNECGILCRKG